MNPTLTQIALKMVAEVQQRGQTPICFLMNQVTIQAVIAENMAVVNQRRSAIGRAWHWLRYRNAVPKLEVLHGVPVMLAPYIPNGGMYLQSAVNGQLPGMPPPAAQSQQSQPPSIQDFQQREPVAAGSAPTETVPTLNDLSSGGGERPSASDILMKAMENADGLAGVVVVRVWPNQSIDLCLNVDPYAASGILQKAMVYLMHGGL